VIYVKKVMTHAEYSKKTESGGKKNVTAETYSRLLHSFSPVAIEDEAEHERALAKAKSLMSIPDKSEAEIALLKLLAVLIENYEQQNFSMGEASPVEVLKELMLARDMKPKDLWPFFSSKGVISEVLSGKRGISKSMAVKLGELFHVSPAMFI
jgi:HTH-type transcriptional regulator/antitoxin HigA